MPRPYEYALKSKVNGYGSEKAHNESHLEGHSDNAQKRSEAEVEDGHGTAGNHKPRGATAKGIVGEVWLLAALPAATNWST